MLRRRAVSPAANRWQGDLIQALQSQGQRVLTVGHVPEAAWPHGQLLMRKDDDALGPGLAGELIGYLNIPFVRVQTLSLQYRRTVDEICRTYGPPTRLITYNAYDYNVSAAHHLQRTENVSWICVVADAPGEGRPYDKYQAQISMANGCVFLGWAAYEGFVGLHKLHLDGGVAKLRFDSQPNESCRPVIMFSGTLNKYTGVDLLAKGFHLVDAPDAELWITGPGVSETVNLLAAEDSRIKVFGLVTDAELNRLSTQAGVFVNPRPASIPDNRMNFPSKVLEYLSYGKPVISTWTPGLSPNYRNVLVVLDEETPECVAKTIEEVLAWNEQELTAWRAGVASFLTQEKLWSVQASSLLRWLNRVHRCPLQTPEVLT